MRKQKNVPALHVENPVFLGYTSKYFSEHIRLASQDIRKPFMSRINDMVQELSLGKPSSGIDEGRQEIVRSLLAEATDLLSYYNNHPLAPHGRTSPPIDLSEDNSSIESFADSTFSIMQSVSSATTFARPAEIGE